ncbi:MAG: exonuclease domain-containing protein [Congregibacter sp.]
MKKVKQEGYAQKPVQSRELPDFYYHAHFLEMLEFVGAHYGHVLAESQHTFIRRFADLPFSAQCLYVRMVNRKGILFARGRLRYAEIGDVASALDALGSAGFLGQPCVDQLDEMLGFMTRTQLLQALRPQLPGLKNSLKKAEILSRLREHTPQKQLFEWLPTDGIVVQGRADDVSFLLFLFFGAVQEGLSRFTMRDLGLVRAHDSSEHYEARFADRDDATDAYFFAKRLQLLHQCEHLAHELASEISHWPTPRCAIASDFRDKFAWALGGALGDDPVTALRVYQRGESAGCTEKVFRLLLAIGERDRAQRFLERCIEKPASDEEALLASDLYARKFHKKRTSALTDCLRAAAVIHIDEAHRGAPERAAVEWYRARGHRAFRTENGLWRTLFGLLFWDLLFEGDAAGLNSPFERLPSSLTERRFSTEHTQAIAERLMLLADRKRLQAYLLRVCAARFGKSNGIFRWRQPILDAMHAMIEFAPADGLHQILMMLCDDYESARHGFPDLMLIAEDGLRFIEIKTDGDQLRRNQLLRLQQLQRAGFRADVVRVRWVLDSAQAYVVVDVETTGGRGEQHRVTEIGAVKVVGGEIVGRFQTLLNPQRSIPPGITRLTGISPEMVADAPVFADIADKFIAFLDSAIFVAHNVEFDYRFIGQEFRRLGRSFKMPKLCTCASMRKLYPGHKSYSLAELTRSYDIPLPSHHRALCDAEAAAQLLLMINEKRVELLEPTTSD